MFIEYGTIHYQNSAPQKAYSRFLAYFDVLGMKSWLQQSSADVIAASMDDAFVACGNSSSGKVDEVRFGPLIDVAQFSDSLLAWSPDDSWTSFYALRSSVESIVATALLHGVPLRGSIVVGEAVCNPSKQLFVGRPIVDACEWSEKSGQRPYRSVGVDVHPKTIEWIRAKLRIDPLTNYQPAPYAFKRDSTVADARVFDRQIDWSPRFVWHKEMLFVNHWSGAQLCRYDPVKLFLSRGLEVDGIEAVKVQQKISDMLEFHHLDREMRATYDNLDTSHFHVGPTEIQEIKKRFMSDLKRHGESLLALDALRVARQKNMAETK